MPKAIRSTILITLGWIFVVLGVLGIFLPILQGLLFLAIGFVLLSRESPFVKRRIDALKTKYPKFGAKYDEAEATLNRWWRKLTGKGADPG